MILLNALSDPDSLSFFNLKLDNCTLCNRGKWPYDAQREITHERKKTVHKLRQHVTKTEWRLPSHSASFLLFSVLFVTVFWPPDCILGSNCRYFLNIRPDGGGGEVILTTPTGFSRIAKKQRRTAPPFLHTFSYINLAPFQNISTQGHLRSGHQVRSSNLTKKKYLGFRRYYSLWGINMKLSGVDKSISTYKTYISKFWLRWPKVRSILRPHRYKARGKCSYAVFPKVRVGTGNVLFISRYSYIGPLSMTRMQFWPNDLSFRSFEVIWGHIRFWPLTFDGIEKERWDGPNMFLFHRRIDWYAIWPTCPDTWPHVTLTWGQILMLTF